MGYSNVRDYAEGKEDWIDAGLPVESAQALGEKEQSGCKELIHYIRQSEDFNSRD